MQRDKNEPCVKTQVNPDRIYLSYPKGGKPNEKAYEYIFYSKEEHGFVARTQPNRDTQQQEQLPGKMHIGASHIIRRKDGVFNQSIEGRGGYRLTVSG